ncbi:MAG: polysaccharide deacetylase family protein [Desulfobacterales bacterium]|nr:polysaccharide deacetylase family protein [Desulfobacterales bacterium]
MNCEFKFTVAELTGFIAYTLAVLFFFVHADWLIWPLVFFLTVCFIAIFLPGFGFFLPIISRGKTGTNAIAITFDDGPDPVSTPKLLALLQKYNINVTFFVIGEKVSRYPELIHQIISHGHAIGNHSYSHDLFLMLKKSSYIQKEIQMTQEILFKLGIKPLVFRAPVGITNPRLHQILKELNLYAVNFSCKANDFGNRRINGLSQKILHKLKPDAIVLLHDACPNNPSLLSEWLNEIEKILTGIQHKGFIVLPLSEIIHREVMI